MPRRNSITIPEETPKALPRNPASSLQTQEFGGRPGPEPTRYGDWENKGRCTDF